MVRRDAQAIGKLALGILLSCSGSFALDPSLDVSQYAHTAWKIRDGLIKGSVHAITQTPDGYLWVGTEFGLLRFDGVRFVSWPPAGQSLPATNIWTLLTARDGALWIGTGSGLASWKNGTLKRYTEFDGHRIYALTEDHEGSIWAGTYAVPAAKLCSIAKTKVECFGEDGILGNAVTGLREDSNGNLWVVASQKLWRWKPGPPEVVPSPDPVDFISEGNNTEVLIGARGILRLVGRKLEPYPIPRKVQPFRTSRGTLRDRDGSLWIPTSQGLMHIQKGKTDTFSQISGLSGDQVFTVFEDREGNIWVGTNQGMDRFRDFAVATYSRGQGLQSESISSVLADKDGSVLIGSVAGLSRWNHDRVTEYIPVADGGLQALFQDSRGRIWMASRHGADYLDRGKLVHVVPSVPASTIVGFAEDREGNIWINHEHSGLIRLVEGRKREQISLAQLHHQDPVLAFASDPVQGGLWLGFQLGGIAYFRDGEIRKSYGVAEGLAGGSVNSIVANPDGALWVASDGGLSYVDKSRITALTSSNGLPCDPVHSIIEDDFKSFWLTMPCGLVRIATAELQGWLEKVRSGNISKTAIRTSSFHGSDGVRSVSSLSAFTPRVAKASNGKLWMATPSGLGVIDPRRIPVNNMPIPVRIEEMTADDNLYDEASVSSGTLRLPARTRNVEIAYTALSLAAPEKIRFRYKLEGHDSDWREAGDRRQALYNDLDPRSYRFRVIASNNGEWNEAGASFDFSVEPAYYETTWFRVAAVAAFLTMLAGLHRLRIRYLTRQYNIRLEERVNERTRIARDLHDTLLQSFQGALLKFYAVGYQLPEGSNAKQSLEEVIEQVRSAIAEGRDALQGLRSSRLSSDDLAEAMTVLTKAIAEQTGQSVPDFQVQTEGLARRLTQPVLDEIYQFSNEALRNAFQHANAKHIEVEIHFDRRQFRLRIRDDGNGIDPEVLRAGGRPGHYGLAGMHERGKQAGGKVAIWSEAASGTEVELTIPSRIAYAKPPARRWPTPW